MVVLFIIIIIFIIISSSITIHVELLKNNHNDEIIIELKALFGLIKLKREYPLISLKIDEEVALEISEETEGNFKKGIINEKNKKIELDNLVDKISSSMNLFKRYKGVGDYAIKKISWKTLMWETEVGFEDAAATGLIVGLINILKTNVFVYIKNNEIGFKKISLNAIPNFNSKIIKITLNCIFRIKVGYIIIAGLKFLKIRLKNI